MVISSVRFGAFCARPFPVRNDQRSGRRLTRHRSKVPPLGEWQHDHVTDDELSRYLAEIAAFETPSAETEAAWLVDARKGDQVARDKIVEGLLQLAADSAKAVRPPGVSEIDAIQEANVVVTRLVDDPEVANPRAALAEAIDGHLRSL